MSAQQPIRQKLYYHWLISLTMSESFLTVCTLFVE